MEEIVGRIVQPEQLLEDGVTPNPNHKRSKDVA